MGSGKKKIVTVSVENINFRYRLYYKILNQTSSVNKKSLSAVNELYINSNF